MSSCDRYSYVRQLPLLLLLLLMLLLLPLLSLEQGGLVQNYKHDRSLVSEQCSIQRRPGEVDFWTSKHIFSPTHVFQRADDDTRHKTHRGRCGGWWGTDMTDVAFERSVSSNRSIFKARVLFVQSSAMRACSMPAIMHACIAGMHACMHGCILIWNFVIEIVSFHSSKTMHLNNFLNIVEGYY